MSGRWLHGMFPYTATCWVRDDPHHNAQRPKERVVEKHNATSGQSATPPWACGPLIRWVSLRRRRWSQLLLCNSSRPRLRGGFTGSYCDPGGSCFTCFAEMDFPENNSRCFQASTWHTPRDGRCHAEITVFRLPRGILLEMGATMAAQLTPASWVLMCTSARTSVSVEGRVFMTTVSQMSWQRMMQSFGVHLEFEAPVVLQRQVTRLMGSFGWPCTQVHGRAVMSTGTWPHDWVHACTWMETLLCNTESEPQPPPPPVVFCSNWLLVPSVNSRKTPAVGNG